MRRYWDRGRSKLTSGSNERIRTGYMATERSQVRPSQGPRRRSIESRSTSAVSVSEGSGRPCVVGATPHGPTAGSKAASPGPRIRPWRSRRAAREPQVADNLDSHPVSHCKIAEHFEGHSVSHRKLTQHSDSHPVRPAAPARKLESDLVRMASPTWRFDLRASTQAPT